jgi:hypothetical protein
MQKATRLKATRVMDALLNPYLALGMTCLLPLLECINSLVKFAQSRNVFICDFFGALTTCQAQLFEMYLDEGKAFTTHHFVDFKQMAECRHEQIHVKWDLNMNDSSEVLAFTVGNRILPAKHGDEIVSKEAWVTLIADVKAECSGIEFLALPSFISHQFVLVCCCSS